MSVRVRIAPSPTGDPHVGTAYIALLNYCFAKSQGGSFILRVEDTDQGRCTPESKQAIMDCMRWLGLEYDEGPDIGGEHGPYEQSQRVEAGIYKKYSDQLVEQGDAYPCFCSSEDLTTMREAQRAAGEPIMYDRRCRDLSKEEAQARIDAGDSHVIRMKTPLEGEHSYPDRLRKNPVVKQWVDVDDQVLLKADGWPTYHLAAVVDDHLMGITHVIRAEEWLNSLPKHTWLNKQLGFEVPEYIHVGLLRNADKSKISKRKNPTNVLWYRDQGYLPGALLNFLCLLGHSHPEERDQFDLEEMVRIFDLSRLSVAGPVFDMDKLKFLQGLWFRDLSPEQMCAVIHQSLDYRMDELLPLVAERMITGGDFCNQADIFYADDVRWQMQDVIPKGWDANQTRKALDTTVKSLRKLIKKGKLEWTAADIEKGIKDIAEKNDWKPKQYYMTLRVAATGRKDSPPLFESLEAIGQLKVFKRIEALLPKIR